MPEQTTLVAMAPSRTDIPEDVAQRRKNVGRLARSLQHCYRRLIDRRVETELRALPQWALGDLRKVLSGVERELAKLPRIAVNANIIVSAVSKDRECKLAKAKCALLEERLIPAFRPSELPQDLVVSAALTAKQLRGEERYICARDLIVDGLVRDAVAFVQCGLLGKISRDPILSASEGEYSYILCRVEERVETSTTDWQERYDADAPLGERRVFERARSEHHGERHAREEHTHRLENLRTSPFQTYDKPLPPWAVPLWEEIPEWIARELQVIEGTIVHEEISVLDEYTKEWTIETPEIVKMSPAVALGDLVLAGWSEADLRGGIPTWLILGGLGILLVGSLACFFPSAALAVGRVALAAGRFVGRAAVVV